jgi:release factor glutamine methyltransferase
VPTASDLVVEGSARLAMGHHPERARLDVETLLLHVVEKNKAWLLAHGDEELPVAKIIRYREHLEQRYRGEPIQYITGAAEFFGLPFHVTCDVLIPRPETEHLVEKAIALAAALPAPRIVDVGTGSGAIAVALAHHLPHAHVTAVDISPAALKIAGENARLNGVADRVRFLHGDLLGPVDGEHFDFVVSNPPYVPETDRPSLAVEVRGFEPALALFAGGDGLDIYRRLVPAAVAVLGHGGRLLLEIGFGQADAVSDLLRANGFERIEGTSDLQGITRVLCGQSR